MEVRTVQRTAWQDERALKGLESRKEEEREENDAGAKTVGARKWEPDFDRYEPGGTMPPQKAEEPEGNMLLPEREKPETKAPEEEPEKKSAPGKKPEKEPAEKCTANTDKVDREIEKLKKKKEQLEQKIVSEKDAEKREKLEKELAETEAELSQKDNEGYRRRHTQFS